MARGYRLRAILPGNQPWHRRTQAPVQVNSPPTNHLARAEPGGRISFNKVCLIRLFLIVFLFFCNPGLFVLPIAKKTWNDSFLANDKAREPQYILPYTMAYTKDDKKN